jgi:hypothetical protein
VAVDPTKLKKPGRRGLGLPPKDGSPGIEESSAKVPSDLEPSRSWLHTAESQKPAGPGAEPEPEPGEHPVIPRAATRVRAAGEQHFERGHRIPAPHTEPRIPFTTRITASTKERLEDACYHLRRRHQDFINEAIVAHLEKHGF